MFKKQGIVFICKSLQSNHYSTDNFPLKKILDVLLFRFYLDFNKVVLCKYPSDYFANNCVLKYYKSTFLFHAFLQNVVSCLSYWSSRSHK